MLIFPVAKQNIKLWLLSLLHCILDLVTQWFMLATESNQLQCHDYTKELNLILNIWYFASKSTDKRL